MLRGEVCARALRLSQSSKDYSLKRVGSIILPAPSKEETVHEIILKPHLSRFCVCYWIEESTLLVAQSVGHAEPGTSASPVVWLWCRPRWPHMQFHSVERRFLDELQPACAVLRQGCPFRRSNRFSTAVHEAELLQAPLERSAISISIRPLLTARYPRLVGSCIHESMDLFGFGSRLLGMRTYINRVSYYKIDTGPEIQTS